MSILAATLLCDRKASSQLIGIKAVSEMHGIDKIYVNIERSKTVSESYRPLYAFLGKCETPSQVEYWFRSRWNGAEPTYDQDQRRLLGIVPARNMAIDYALHYGAEWLLFVDADVIPEPDGLAYLLTLGKPLVGGYVPGRGAHGSLHYVFPSDFGIEERKDHFRCGHGTCGYMMIHRSIFTRLRFRYGWDQKEDWNWLSEDPAYCQDARALGLSDGFYIAKNARARHWDDPEHPLTTEETCKENFPNDRT